MKRLLIFILLLSSTSSFAQDKTSTDKIIGSYTSELNLEANQAKKLETIINTYKQKLNKSTLSANDFNKIIKLRSLEIYNILNEEQFRLYKKIQSEIEPELNYRFE